MAMKTLLMRSTWCLAMVAVLLGGCESMQAVRDSVRERFAPVPPHVQVVPGRPQAIYAAARRAMKRLGYQITTGDRMDGRLEGFTRVDSGDGFQGSYQRRIRVRIEPGGRDNMAVQVTVYEIEGSAFGQSSGPATETALRDSPTYDAFFSELTSQLQQAAHQ